MKKNPNAINGIAGYTTKLGTASIIIKTENT
jgi:hypothetical protein